MLRKKTLLLRYSDWLKIFSTINKNENIKQNYLILINGKLKDKNFSLNLFILELLKFINFQLNVCIVKFNNQINKYLSINDYDSIHEIIFDFSKNINYIKFYKHLKFLPLDVINNLTNSIDENIVSFIKTLKRKIIVISDMNNRLFEIHYLLSKYFNLRSVQNV